MPARPLPLGTESRSQAVGEVGAGADGAIRVAEPELEVPGRAGEQRAVAGLVLEVNRSDDPAIAVGLRCRIEAPGATTDAAVAVSEGGLDRAQAVIEEAEAVSRRLRALEDEVVRSDAC